MEILIVIGAIVVGLLLLGFLFWIAIGLGVIAFIAYLISSATGIPFQGVFVAGIVAAVLLYLVTLFS